MDSGSRSDLPAWLALVEEGGDAFGRLGSFPDGDKAVDAVFDHRLVDARTKLVYLSNPANPTGSFATGEEIRRLHAGLPAHVILVIDEAYAEFVTEPDWESAFDLARTAPNVVVTRTFSKLHGLGGLRVGFGYAPPAVEQAIDRIRLPFNVSVPGIEAAIAALGDEAHQKASRDLVAEWRQR